MGFADGSDFGTSLLGFSVFGAAGAFNGALTGAGLDLSPLPAPGSLLPSGCFSFVVGFVEDSAAFGCAALTGFESADAGPLEAGFGGAGATSALSEPFLLVSLVRTAAGRSGGGASSSSTRSMRTSVAATAKIRGIRSSPSNGRSRC
jgi:hypothetical protein